MNIKSAKSWMKSWLVAVFAAGCVVATVRGNTETVDGIQWTYMVSGGVATIRSESSEGPAIPQSTTGAVSIPSTLEGYPVTSIGYEAFYGCSGLTSVTIPDSVTSIGYEAFCSCSGLTSVTIPDSVTIIGSAAFSNCIDLTSVTILGNVTNDWWYYHNAPFSGCSNLTTVTLGGGMTTIGSIMFYGCSNLTNVAIPDNVTRIGVASFSGCSGLTSVTIPDNVTSIEEEAFSGCRGLTNVTILGNVTNDWWQYSRRPFSNCTHIATVELGKKMTKIGSYLFYGCNELTDVTIPDSVTDIGNYTFSGCSGLTNATIGNGVTNIGAYAFTNCYNIKTLDIPDSVQSIGCCAFEDCKGLVACNIGKGLESIGEGPDGHAAFANAYTLTAFSVDPENPNFKTENGALYTKDGKELIAFPAGCRGEFAVPNGVEKIWAGAFCGTFELKLLILPDSLMEIGQGVFSGCTSLADVYLPARFKGNESFYSKPSKCTFHYERPIDRTLTLDGQGGIVETVTIHPIYCEAMPKVSVPTREGYRFGGYFSEPNGGGVQYYTAKGESCRTWDSLTVTTLYALWLEKTDSLPEAGDEATVASVLAGAADGRLKERIGSVEEYGAFRAWVSAKGLDAESVLASPHAWISYALGADGLFENEPTIQIGGVAIALEVRVIVNDGEREVLVDADKVAGMFEATGDAGDWGGEGKLPAVAMPTEADGAEMRFKVVPGDGTAGAAFLRIAS